MFHKHKKYFAMIGMGACLSLLPASSFAVEAAAPDISPQSQVHTPAAGANGSLLKDMSFQDIRRETQAKISDTRAWAKDQNIPQDIKFLIHDMEKATDQLQDSVSPVGYSIKSFVRDKMPGKAVAHHSDKTVTVYGLLLILAFAFVFLMMSLANPESRLGGRH